MVTGAAGRSTLCAASRARSRIMSISHVDVQAQLCTDRVDPFLHDRSLLVQPGAGHLQLLGGVHVGHRASWHRPFHHAQQRAQVAHRPAGERVQPAPAARAARRSGRPRRAAGRGPRGRPAPRRRPPAGVGRQPLPSAPTSTGHAERHVRGTDRDQRGPDLGQARPDPASGPPPGGSSLGQDHPRSGSPGRAGPTSTTSTRPRAPGSAADRRPDARRHGWSTLSRPSRVLRPPARTSTVTPVAQSGSPMPSIPAQ